MRLSLLSAALGGSRIASVRALSVRRDTTSLGRFYAYGANMTGVPMFYADGLAYLGDPHPSHAHTTTNVTFSENSSADWVATPTNSTVSQNWTTPRLFIDQSEGAFVTAGFTSATNTTVTTTGFDVFGTLLVWRSDEGELESKWYAAPTAQKGLYLLKWNVDNVLEDNAVPVALKNLAPITL